MIVNKPIRKIYSTDTIATTADGQQALFTRHHDPYEIHEIKKITLKYMDYKRHATFQEFVNMTPEQREIAIINYKLKDQQSFQKALERGI